MDIADWRKKIDDVDRRLVELLNERATFVCEIGLLKHQSHSPIYEPARERQIFANLEVLNRGPLPNRELAQIFQRILDVMRNFEKVNSEAASLAQQGPSNGASRNARDDE